MKDRKGALIVNAFQSILHDSRRKPNNRWFDQGSESVVAERFIRTLKNKIYKYMTAVSKNVYFILLINTITHIIGRLECSLLMLNLVLMLNTALILMSKMLNLK